jgi:hypothetical protein
MLAKMRELDHSTLIKFYTKGKRARELNIEDFFLKTTSQKIYFYIASHFAVFLDVQFYPLLKQYCLSFKHPKKSSMLIKSV